MQRLDGHIEVTSGFPIACGGYSDIYSGIWTGDATSGRNVAVGTVHIYIVPLPHSRTLPLIKVAIKVDRDAHRRAKTFDTKWYHAKASINGSLSLSWPP